MLDAAVPGWVIHLPLLFLVVGGVLGELLVPGGGWFFGSGFGYFASRGVLRITVRRRQPVR